MEATASFIQKLGVAVKRVSRKRCSTWYTPPMAAASRAILERIPAVDFVLEVRDARVPMSSRYHNVRDFRHDLRHIIVLNKVDLISRSQMKAWTTYFEQEKSIYFGVNSHNKETIKEFLNFLQAQVRDFTESDHANHTFTMMLVGIPNVGKSGLANSLHHIGRISAAEKGKLKHAIVSPQPGETREISSLKIGSHPNIYVLDTPGILPPEISDAEVCAKLALTGTFKDYLIGEVDMAQYFLAVVNSSDEYKKWEKFSATKSERQSDSRLGASVDRSQSVTDHTQDSVVHDVRGTLFETISTFNGDLEDGKDLTELIEVQFRALGKAFHVDMEAETEARSKVASKLLNLYRTGRLGQYTLDFPPGFPL